ncbi:unnamed protein product [Gadus morhua 'NCC']
MENLQPTRAPVLPFPSRGRATSCPLSHQQLRPRNVLHVAGLLHHRTVPAGGGSPLAGPRSCGIPAGRSSENLRPVSGRCGQDGGRTLRSGPEPRGPAWGVGPNTYEWILYQYATAKAGIIMVSVNPAYQLNELEYTMRKVKCNAVVCPTRFKTQEFCQMLREICPEINTAASGRIQSSRLPDLQDGDRHGQADSRDAPCRRRAAGRESSHHKQLQDLQSKLSFDDPSTSSLLRRCVRLCLPGTAVPLLRLGAGRDVLSHARITLVFPSAGFNSRANLQAIQDERCNFLYGTPTMFIDMLSQPDLQQLRPFISRSPTGHRDQPGHVLGIPVQTEMSEDQHHRMHIRTHTEATFYDLSRSHL